jgi:hypothetical protein
VPEQYQSNMKGEFHFGDYGLEVVPKILDLKANEFGLGSAETLDEDPNVTLNL